LIVLREEFVYLLCARSMGESSKQFMLSSDLRTYFLNVLTSPFFWIYGPRVASSATLPPPLPPGSGPDAGGPVRHLLQGQGTRRGRGRAGRIERDSNQFEEHMKVMGYNCGSKECFGND